MIIMNILGFFCGNKHNSYAALILLFVNSIQNKVMALVPHILVTSN